jgi:hypothetical protein
MFHGPQKNPERAGGLFGGAANVRECRAGAAGSSHNAWVALKAPDSGYALEIERLEAVTA